MKTKGNAAGPAPISRQLREIIERSGRTIYDLETSAAIPRGGLGRFVSGERGLTLATVDRLAGEIGLRLVEVEKRVGNRRPRPPARPVLEAGPEAGAIPADEAGPAEAEGGDGD